MNRKLTCVTPSAVPPYLTQIVEKMFEHDPNGAMLGFADMMKKQIVMPAHMMNDNQHEAKTGRSLFAVRLGGGSWGVVPEVVGIRLPLKQEHADLAL